MVVPNTSLISYNITSLQGPSVSSHLLPVNKTTFHLVLVLFAPLHQKHGTCYLFIFNAKHTLLSDVTLRCIAFSQSFLPSISPTNAP